MESGLYLYTLIGTLLVLVAAFSSLLARRFGAPLLLVFLLIGLATGVDGVGIDFDDARLAFAVGSLALAVILFDAGFGTPLAAFRQAAAPALLLATVGVLLTTVIFAIFAYLITGLGPLESVLIGAIVSSTDAAAVFFLLRGAGVTLRERIRTTLEIESGSNDPVAIFLTLSLVSLIAAGDAASPGTVALDIVLDFFAQMGIGAAVGVLGGGLIARLVDRLKLDQGLVPIFVLALSLLVFGIAGALGGSGFLAVYLAGLVAGNTVTRSITNLRRFQDGFSWLAQIIMFLVLGLFATPSQFPAILPAAIALGLILIFVARPLAISISLLPFRFSPPETAFISWVGLRGAVSILLALTPLIAGIEQVRAIFNM
ncbi:MAG: potassium/proton antiporter, partial [Cucumibacter sp.]